MGRTSATTIPINGYALRTIRVLTGLGVSDLAAQVEVERSYIAKIELGHSRRVSPAVFRAICDALEIQDRRALMAHPHDANQAVA